MKLSQVKGDAIRRFSKAQIEQIVFGDWTDDGGCGEVALLLGGNPTVLAGRAKAAADLYKAGRVSYLMPTGGVIWETDRGNMTEAEYLALCLKDLGIPEEVILLENDARTTHENMVCGTLLMLRVLKLKNIRKVYVVTSPSHLRRSLALARLYLPRTWAFAGYTDESLPDGPGIWDRDPFYANRVYREAELLFTAIQRGWCDDIEIGE